MTPLDFNALNNLICCGAPLPNCSTLLPPYQVEQDSAFKVSHTKWVEAGLSQAELNVELFTEKILNNVILPLEIRVGDDLPQIDSIDLESFSGNASDFLIDSADGRVLLIIVQFIGFVPDSTTLTARVFITVDSSLLRRQVVMNWTKFAPIQSSPPDSSLVPSVIYYDYGGSQFEVAEPIMICCMGTHGDFNEDGDDGNVLDLTHLVDYIFRGSGDAGSCPEETDLNEDGASSNILDLTTLVDFIFRGGAALPPCYN